MAQVSCVRFSFKQTILSCFLFWELVSTLFFYRTYLLIIQSLLKVYSEKIFKLSTSFVTLSRMPMFWHEWWKIGPIWRALLELKDRALWFDCSWARRCWLRHCPYIPCSVWVCLAPVIGEVAKLEGKIPLLLQHGQGKDSMTPCLGSCLVSLQRRVYF